MAPKRPAADSASDASDGEPDANPSSPSPTKTPPNPSSDPISTPASAAADSDAAGSDSAASDSDAHHAPHPKPSSRRSPPKSDPKPADLNSDSDNAAAAAAGGGAGGGGAGDDDEDASSDSDNDEPPAPAPPQQRPSRGGADASSIKPISSRPMDSGPRRSGGEPRSKRPRSAAVAAASSSEPKRPQRLWSPEDELAILRGLTAYRAKHGALPGSTHDIAKLHGHIRGALSVKVSTSQLSDKVRRLKQKYQALASRARGGKDPADFATPHDGSIYDLAKKVWGSRNGGFDNAIASEEEESGESDEDMETARDDHRKGRRMRAIVMANGNGNRSGNGNGEVEKGKDSYPYLWEAVEEMAREHPSGAVFKRAFEILEGAKARAMEEKLRKFRLLEIRQQLRRMDLMKETVKMVLDALERAD